MDLPRFPNFKKLTLEDKPEIEKYTSSFPPYSDFNFTSMWCYNADNKIEISSIYDNLVVVFTDYISNELFLSFIGRNNILDTIQTLLDYSQTVNLLSVLKLIPELVIQTVDQQTITEKYTIHPDEDNYDYILSSEALKDLSGKKFDTKRNLSNRFKRIYIDHEVRLIDIHTSQTKKEIENLFLLWEKQKKLSRIDTTNELSAIRKIVDINTSEIITVGIYHNNELIGFSINEILANDFAIIHFEKASIAPIGLYQYLNQQTAKILLENGCQYINYEQDLGIPGLRLAKKLHQPTHFLKKYTIGKK